MTRRQVAQRLGKSVAAVRRLEGVLLHPQTDARGVHHFDAEEVEALAQRIQRGDVTIWHELRDTSPLSHDSIGERDVEPCSHCAALEVALEQTTGRARSEQRRHQSELVALQEQRDRERSQYAVEQRRLERELRDLIRAIESM